MTDTTAELQMQADALAERLLEGCSGRHDIALRLCALMRVAIMRDQNKTARPVR